MHKGPVLLDTTAMLEIHRLSGWKALHGAYRLVTVEKCLEEFGTGPRSPVAGSPVMHGIVRAHFAEVAEVTLSEQSAFAVRPGPPIDDGERDLWAHAIGREDGWALCGPDRASMRWGYENGYRDRLISLGRLFSDIGQRPKLRGHYEQAWLDEVIRKLVLGVL